MKAKNIIIAVIVLSLVPIINIKAQTKKELQLIIEGLNTTISSLSSSINYLNQQVGVLSAQQEQQREQIKELKMQVEELKALIAATNESKLVNTGWTKRSDFFSGLAKVQDDNTNKYGFIDKTGKLVIPCEWKAAWVFSSPLEGLALVQNDKGLWGFIDKTGKVVIPCTWKSLEVTDKDIRVKDTNDKWGFLDKNGKLVIPCKWLKVGSFNEDMVSVMDSNRKWGFINNKGQLVIPCNYQSVSRSFEHGVARVQDANGRYITIDKTGRIVK